MWLNLALNLASHGWSYKNIFERSGPTWMPNKSWEIQLAYTTPLQLFEVEISYTTKQDHAGLQTEFALLGLSLSLSIQDNRHWDSKKNDFE
jgi:hypothetical protein